MTSIEKYYREFQTQIQLDAQAGEMLLEDAFIEHAANILQDAGELVTFDLARYDDRRGTRIDGYGGSPVDSDGVMSLVISDYDQGADLTTLTQTEMDRLLRRATSFFERSQRSRFAAGMDETDPGFGVADLLCSHWNGISRLRVFLVTNRILSTRIDAIEASQVANKRVTFSVWDIARLSQFENIGQEDIEVDLVNDFGGAIAAIPTNLPTSAYESYLFAIPGTVLSKIYDKYGTRLLEQNVRVFLQARGAVNKGIRNTLDNDPEMFFAYNNGLAATAAEVTTEEIGQSLCITKLRDFQIVNGGQTTASIHAASKNKAVKLEKVFVQVKLSIVDTSRAIDIVPKISEYANSQNKVNAADFFSTHPFHILLEKLSRTTWAPAPDGSSRQTKWFYERARGQYADERNKRSGLALRKFDTEHPRHQLVTKTDLARYLMVWELQPHTVSQGAQKNFAKFAGFIGDKWLKDPDSFGVEYFQDCIAKVIVFREAEKIVRRQPWFEGSYRANIVAHGIARMAFELQSLGLGAKFRQIWQAQAVPALMLTSLLTCMEAANEVVMSPPAGQRNFSEWAKQQACWAQVQKRAVTLDEQWLDTLQSLDDVKEEVRTRRKNKRQLNGIEAQMAVVGTARSFWDTVREFGIQRKLLVPMDLDIMRVAQTWSAKPPSEKQSLHLVALVKRMADEGCKACEGFGEK